MSTFSGIPNQPPSQPFSASYTMISKDSSNPDVDKEAEIFLDKLGAAVRNSLYLQRSFLMTVLIAPSDL
jgi:hypothetical protein